MQGRLVTVMEALHGTMFNVQNNIKQALKAGLLPITCAGAEARGALLHDCAHELVLSATGKAGSGITSISTIVSTSGGW